MASISADRAARELLTRCLEGAPWPERLLDELIEGEASRALFSGVVEPLADRFEPRLCEVYANLFTEAIARIFPNVHPLELVHRYERVRQPRRLDRESRNVYVLSRVTLGADVAVTSIILDAAKRRFPDAAIWFVAPRKSWELFAGDPRLRHAPIAYGRGATLRDRLAVWPEVREVVAQPDSIVIDPDSRLTQLGLLPVCAENDYYFFESRSYGGESADALPDLTRRWVEETFGAPAAKPYIATGLDAKRFAATVSFGVGENLAKRIPDPFEEQVLKHLPRPVLVDKGAGGEEAERAERAVARAGAGISVWDGSFAGFAEHIARSGLYVGYDSAGGHVAAACGVPLISVFAGFASERMYQRWRPVGRGGIHIVRPDRTNDVIADVLKAIATGTM